MTLLVSFSIAALMTALFAFRYGFWRRPKLLLFYFALFQILEWVSERFLLPEGAFGIEVAYVCLSLTAVFVAVILGVRRYERHVGVDAAEGIDSD